MKDTRLGPDPWHPNLWLDFHFTPVVQSVQRPFFPGFTFFSCWNRLKSKKCICLSVSRSADYMVSDTHNFFLYFRLPPPSFRKRAAIPPMYCTSIAYCIIECCLSLMLTLVLRQYDPNIHFASSNWAGKGKLFVIVRDGGLPGSQAMLADLAMPTARLLSVCRSCKKRLGS